MNFKDIAADMIFGSLTTLKKAGTDKWNFPVWECRCICGNLKTTRASALVTGRTTSCGCSRHLELIGKKFGRLLVVEKMPTRAKNSRWKCVCDCGAIRIVAGTALRKGATQSCGCSRRNPRAGFNMTLSSYKKAARQRNYEWKLTEQEFERLILSDCFYCGEPPKNRKRTLDVADTVFVYNGIDRVNNGLGYVLSNCVSCCTDCNIGKGTKSAEEFLTWIERVYNYQSHGALKMDVAV